MSDALKDAQTLYNESLDAMRSQREQVREDMEFSDPSDPRQWDEDVKRQRENDPGGRRPCLVMDQTGQYIANVAGQVESNPPAIHAIPVGGGAEKEAAEQIDGRFRHIEHVSRAQQHYARAETSAARSGVGYLVIRPTYVDRALGWQEPRISSEPDPQKVVFDPWSVETDGSDATSGFILTSTNRTLFERMWPKKDACDFGETQSHKSTDTRKSVLIAEQWLKETKTRNIVVYYGPDGQETSGTEDEYHAACQAVGAQLEYIRNYTDKFQEVKWRRMSGADILEESVYPADSIGIVPVYGYVSFVDGRMRYCGIARRARYPQQAYNYHKSELMMPGATLIASKRALSGVEKIWDQAQTQRRAFLPYNDQDSDGPINQPGLIKTGSSLIDHVAGAQSALSDIQASIGMYQANLGAASNETSGVAIESRKQQGEASTAIFPSHLAASLGQVGNIVMQMDRKLTDTRRDQPIMGVDGTSGKISVNPKQSESVARGPDGVMSINPNVGKYGVRVVIGASYSTQRSQTNAAFGDIMRGNPDMAPTIAPFWAQTLDFPGSDKFAQALAAMAPEPVKAILQPEGGDKNAPDPAQMAAQMKQMGEALQEAIQHAKDAQQDADEAQAEAQEAKQMSEAKEEENRIKWFAAETDRLKVTGANADQIQAIVGDLINQMLASPNPLPGDADEPPPESPQAWQPGQPMAMPPEVAEQPPEMPEQGAPQPEQEQFQ